MQQNISLHRIYRSLSLFTYADHFLHGVLSFGLPCFVSRWYPASNPLHSLLWLYGAWFISYAARPIGIVYFNTYIRHKRLHTSLMLSISGWLIATVCITFLPYLHLDVMHFSLMLLICRIVGQVCIGGENTMARSILINMPQEGQRIHRNIAYEQAILAGYCVALISIYVIPWLMICSISLLCGLYCLYLRSDIAGNSIAHILPVEKKEKIYISPYILSGTCISYLAYAISTTYVHHMHTLMDTATQTYWTCFLLLWNIILLTLCSRIHTLHYYRRILILSTLMITLGACTIYYTLPYISQYYIYTIQIWTLSFGVIFDIYFYSSIKKVLHKNISYMNYGIHQWSASLCYSKCLPWLLMILPQTSFIFSPLIILLILVAPGAIFLILSCSAPTPRTAQ